MNIKTGIDYFSFDVDFFQDDKIDFVSARFGVKGEVIAIRLLCRIYREGYFIEWNDDKALLFAKRVGDGVSHSLVKDVIRELVKRGFFEESIFNRFNILTSRGIQNRYLEATSRRKRVEIRHELLLVDITKRQNVYILKQNADIKSENVDNKKQSKVKESKGKESNNTCAPVGSTERFNYQGLYDYYMTLDLIQHRGFTKEMRKAIDVARRQGYTFDDIKKLLYRHALVVKASENDGDYSVDKRGVGEFFGQKAHKATHLICSEYADDGVKWRRYQEGKYGRKNNKASPQSDGNDQYPSF